MTINEVIEQLYDLAIAGYFNGEKFTKKRLKSYITAMFKDGSKSLVMNIALPDGRWFFRITQYAPSEFDYYIPDTRETEKRVMAKINI